MKKFIEVSEQILVSTVSQVIVSIFLPTALPLAVILSQLHLSVKVPSILGSAPFLISIIIGLFLLILYRITIKHLKQQKELDGNVQVIGVLISVFYHRLSEEEKGHFKEEVRLTLHDRFGNTKVSHEIEKMAQEIFSKA